MEKQCIKCKETIPTADFNKCVAAKDGFRAYCRQCQKKAARKHYLDNKKSLYEAHSKRYKERKDGKARVYLLPEAHYCGYTETGLTYRLYAHTCRGNLVDGAEVFGVYDTVEEAKYVEGIFHALGWYGKDPKSKSFCLNSWNYV